MPSLIDKWFQYYREVVKHTLNIKPVCFDNQEFIRESIRRVINSYECKSSDDSLLMLGVLRQLIFPLNTDPIIAPEQLHPRFVDFMLDEEMWKKIKSFDRHAKFKLTELLTEISLSYIVKDLKEMYEQEMIFARQDDGRQTDCCC